MLTAEIVAEAEAMRQAGHGGLLEVLEGGERIVADVTPDLPHELEYAKNGNSTEWRRLFDVYKVNPPAQQLCDVRYGHPRCI